jgi:hypothetical protein
MWTNDEHAKTPGGASLARVVRRTFFKWRGYPTNAPIFCTLNCALAFATASFNGGYRRKR